MYQLTIINILPLEQMIEQEHVSTGLHGKKEPLSPCSQSVAV